MKKIILTVAAVFVLSFANAQIKTDAGTFTKPSAGSLQFELSFSPNIAGAASSMFSLPNFYGSNIPGIRARKFMSETKAMRYTGNVSISNSGAEGADTAFTVALGVGVENHMKGAERLSTYWGYEGNIGFQSTAGVAGTFDPITGDPLTPGTAKQTTLGLSAQLFTGFDYYIMPNIYLGCEINYGVAILNTKPDGGDGTTEFKVQPNVLPAFRLGWRF
ncbi:MAG: hypothetical protein ACOYLP_08360 [Flavobacterium sp.]|uniref:hypothetical protein n=1 Tax=Flavobacterium sp. TaxID=239 RepID=UPI003BD71891